MRHYWIFQNAQNNPKVAQQNINEMTNLAEGLLEFEKTYLRTHGERTPVFRLLSMINTAITEQIAIIERHLIDNPVQRSSQDETSQSDIPF